MRLIGETVLWQTLILLLLLYVGPASTTSAAPRAEVAAKPVSEGSESSGGTSSHDDPESNGSNRDKEGSSSGQSSDAHPYVPGDVQSGQDPGESNPGSPLFSDWDDSEHYKELAEHVSDLLEAYASSSATTATATTSSRSSTMAPAIVVTSAPSQASVGCQVFHSYTSICSSYVVGTAPQSAHSDLASCACYSASFYVPNAFDRAAHACAASSTASSGALPTSIHAMATAASKMENFCSSMGNVQSLSSAQFGQTTASATPTSSSDSGHSNDGTRRGAAGLSLWAAVGGSVMLL
ncbi:hypothetical protein N7492_004255 [Penicillium capsulatum]|uniref:Extracellular membrane protein CFEM domain-containing protein n=1 Tax=Penicillium capsulatum TaxID=69766 RepID=A0A9W9IDF7_9EURO|nr:hypothetical protein N7492_004255 [Penicillium capsulatum]KAJ6136624.1 hypothetical protein N7512_001784 [Penicillium capsulatum]